MTTQSPSSFVFPAQYVTRVLGFGPGPYTPPPLARHDGELIIWYGGWPLPRLKASWVGRTHMWPDGRFDELFGRVVGPPSGYCRFLPLVPGTTAKPWTEQLNVLEEFDGGGWQPAPAAIAATAVLLSLVALQQNPLHDQWRHCAERLSDGSRAGLGVIDGRLKVLNIREGTKMRRLGLAACRYEP